MRDDVVVEVPGCGQLLFGSPPTDPAACCLPGLGIPPLGAAVRDCMRRIAARRRLDERVGSRVRLPRLGVSVLVHGPIGSGWLCTLVGADRSTDELPVGAAVISSVEIAAGSPRAVEASGPEGLRDTWRIRLADRGVPAALGEALLGAADPHHTVNLQARSLLMRSGCRTRAAFGRRCRDLLDLGALHAVPGTDPAREVRIALPDPLWSW